jgi:hypothetical protein
MSYRLTLADLVPREHVVDTSYVTSEHLVSAQERGTDLLGPVLEDQSWARRHQHPLRPRRLRRLPRAAGLCPFAAPAHTHHPPTRPV